MKQYTVEYVDYDGTVLQTADYDFGTDLSGVTAPTDPSRERYTFSGWYSDINLNTPYIFGSMPAEDITLHGKWVSND